MPESLQSSKYLLNSVEFSFLECFEKYGVSVLGLMCFVVDRKCFVTLETTKVLMLVLKLILTM